MRSGKSGENFVVRRVTDFKIEDPALMRRMMEIKRGTKTTRWNMSKMWAVLTDKNRNGKGTLS